MKLPSIVEEGESDLESELSYHSLVNKPDNTVSNGEVNVEMSSSRPLTGKAEDESWTFLKKEVKLLLNNKDYLILFAVFSIGVGFFNSILTLLNQLVEPFGYR